MQDGRRSAVAEALRRVAEDLEAGQPDLDVALVLVADDALTLAELEAPTLDRAEHIAGVRAAVGTLGGGLPVALSRSVSERFGQPGNAPRANACSMLH